MSYPKSIRAFLVPVYVLILSLNCKSCKAQLSDSSFYATSCPNALTTIKNSVSAEVSRNPRAAALFIRLHFHDCFVQGCDASILLDAEPSEKTSPANNGVRGYEEIDTVKAAVESVCPGVVSCADILAVAARDASVEVGGPSWEVNLGRRDSTTANPGEAATDLPRGDMGLTRLIDNFGQKNLSPRDMVALSGSHTIGRARCVTFRARIYDNTSDINATYASELRSNCPQAATPDTNAILFPLDPVTPDTFDNNYYTNLVDRRGLLISDQALFSGGSTDSIVNEYVTDPSRFDSDFAAAMVRMGNLLPPASVNSSIRTLCTTAN